MSAQQPTSSLASYVVSVVSILSGLFLILTYQFLSVRVLAPIADIVVSSSDTSIYGGESMINGIFGTVTTTVPVLAGIGLIVIGVVVEFRRRRTAAARRRGPR